MNFDYDVCFYYNLTDGDAVNVIADRLTNEARLQVLLDPWHLPPEEPWQAKLEQILNRCATCVIFLGSSPLSEWLHPHLQAVLEHRALTYKLRIIAVQLPISPQTPPGYDKLLTQPIDFTNGIDDQQAFENLVTRICGYNLPGQPPDLEQTSSESNPPGRVIAGSLMLPLHFQLRPELDQLRAFWGDGSGMLALIGLGGSGKTALVRRFLQELPESGLDQADIPKNNSLPPPDGVFGWSFYDQPNIEAFMQALHTFLTGQEILIRPARDLTYRVIRHLEQTRQRYLFVLDGLEIVQEPSDSPGGFGLLRDSSLRHLVRRLAHGDLSCWLLATSRFPFPDLVPFQSKGFQLVKTDQLERSSACDLLRAGGVVGSEAALEALVTEFGAHALTLEHLAIVLRDFFEGDAYQAQRLPASNGENQVHHLARLFAFYEAHLPAVELKLLRLLCLLRIDIPVALVADILAKAGDNESPALLLQIEPQVLEATLAQLSQRSLIYIYQEREQAYCAVHPTVRAYFQRTIGETQPQVHAQIQGYYWNTLREGGMWETEPLDAASLDLYENIIDHRLQAGQQMEAANLYAQQLGGYRHMGWRLADYQRGLRLTTKLIDVGGMQLQGLFSTRPWHERCLYQLDLGRPQMAETQLRELLVFYKQQLVRKQEVMELMGKLKELDQAQFEQIIEEFMGFTRWAGDDDSWFYYEASLLQSICDTLLAQGKLVEAEQLAASIITNVGPENWQEMAYLLPESGSNPFGRVAVARYLLGDVPAAIQDFRQAEALYRYSLQMYRQPALGGYDTATYIMLLAHLGKVRSARKTLYQCNLEIARKTRPLLAAQYELAAAEIHLVASQDAEALPYIESALAWAMQSGHQETYVRANLTQARVLLRRSKVAEAQARLTETESLARTCGFMIHLIDTLVVAGHLALLTKNLEDAGQQANEAIRLSNEAGCKYRWGVGNASHLLAEVAFARGNLALARQQAQTALQHRDILQDPKRGNTQQLLARITDSHQPD